MRLEQAAREVIRQHSMECLSDKSVDALREALAEQAEQEPSKNQYNHKRIGWELERTAQGESYYGNALYVAMDLPFLNKREKDCLHRYMHGSETPNDRFVLQDIAMKVYSEPEAAPVQQAEQEPVAWALTSENGEVLDCISHTYKVTQPCTVDYDEPLYAAPVRTKDLTDEEITNEWESMGRGLGKYTEFARAVIAADREKNK